MPYQRKDKNGNVIAEKATRMPTAAELEARKQAAIEEQNKQRAALEKQQDANNSDVQASAETKATAKKQPAATE